MSPNVIQSGQSKGEAPGRVSITGPFRTVEPVEIRLGATGPVMIIPGGLDVPAGMTVTFAPTNAGLSHVNIVDDSQEAAG